MIPSATDGGIYTEKTVQLPLRELSESDAKNALATIVSGTKAGFTDIKLFGRGAEQSWTVAIMSNLKEMAREIQRGRLSWILATAMPLRDDFVLYLDGNKIQASKTKGLLKRWILGKDLQELPSPAPDTLQSVEAPGETSDSPLRYGLTHPQLGRITGYAELYRDNLTTGKSTGVDRSYGFFVYVLGRLVNLDDEYFGIDSNALRHGTFSKFRLVVHIDRLDDDLRSSREAIREGTFTEIARNILRGVFNYVRTKQEEIESTEAAGIVSASRFAASPTSIARSPIVGLVVKAFEGKITPRYTRFPAFSDKTQREEFVTDLQKRASEGEAFLREVQIAEDLSQNEGIAVFDTQSGILKINALHPFVAHYIDEYAGLQKNISLELVAMSEVLLEAHLSELDIEPNLITDILARRDELLRFLSRATGKRNAYIVAMALLDASTNQDQLEKELVAAVDCIGFSDAIHIGGKGNPDGYGEARLGVDTTTQCPLSYKITLEAKSKERPGTKVSAKSVGVSTLVRQRDSKNADYVLVVGPDFPTTQGEQSALAKEIVDDRKSHTGKGITLVRIEDMARLVRLVPAKRIGLNRLRELFETCSLPEQSKKWIDQLITEKTKLPPYREILEAIAAEQKDMPNRAIDYNNIITYLRLQKKLTLDLPNIRELCKALANMAVGYVFARDTTVELNQRPDKILDAISATIRQYPENEQRTIPLLDSVKSKQP